MCVCVCESLSERERESKCTLVSFSKDDRSQDVHGCYHEPGFPW